MSQFCTALDDLSSNCRTGLQALGSSSSKVQPENTRELTGSIDLDSALQSIFPSDPRWDYGIGYQTEEDQEAAYWIEVHPANTSNVKEVINKLRWLKTFLGDHPHLQRLTDRAEKPYRWVASGSVSISRNTKYARLLSQEGLALPKSSARIP